MGCLLIQDSKLKTCNGSDLSSTLSLMRAFITAWFFKKNNQWKTWILLIIRVYLVEN